MLNIRMNIIYQRDRGVFLQCQSSYIVTGSSLISILCVFQLDKIRKNIVNSVDMSSLRAP